MSGDVMVDGPRVFLEIKASVVASSRYAWRGVPLDDRHRSPRQFSSIGEGAQRGGGGLTLRARPRSAPPRPETMAGKCTQVLTIKQTDG